MPEYKVVFHPLRRPMSGGEAAALHEGMSINQLVAAILENKDGRYDHLYQSPRQGSG